MTDLNLEDRIVAALRQIMRAVDLHSRRLVEVCGLTGPQLAVLQEARRLGPVSATTLARAVHLSLPTLVGILGRLEARGLVRRSRDASDRRSKSVNITDAGRDMLEKAPSLLQDRFRAELGRLEEWERYLMLSNLQRIATIMGAESLEAAPHLVANGLSLGTAASKGEAPSSTMPHDGDLNSERSQ